MIRIFSFLIVYLASFISYCQSNYFEINGHIAELGNSTIYLYKVNYFYGIGDTNQLIDSAKVNNGRFTIEGIYKEPGLFVLEVSKNMRRSILFILEKGVTNIEQNPNILSNIEISSGREQEAYKAYRELRSSDSQIELSNNLTDSVMKYKQSDRQKSIHYANESAKIKSKMINDQLSFVRKNRNAYVSILILDHLIRDGVDQGILLREYNLLIQELKEIQMQNSF